MVKSRSNATLWDQVPPQERHAIEKRLSDKRQEPPTKPQRKSGFSLIGYVRCELSVSDRDRFREWEGQQDAGVMAQGLLALAESGYLVKASPNGTGYQVSLCASETGESWDGYVLVGHAGSVGRAVAVTMYKHGVLLQSDWSGWIDSGSEESFR